MLAGDNITGTSFKLISAYDVQVAVDPVGELYSPINFLPPPKEKKNVFNQMQRNILPPKKKKKKKKSCSCPFIQIQYPTQ